MTSRTYTFKALSSLWTGTARVEEKHNKKSGRNELVDVVFSSRLITTGLLGSIRWWYEVVARGLGGTPCDPSDTRRCIDRKHCIACELFGCTGWARKFRFDVLDEHGAGQQSQITKDQVFKLRFTPLRAVRDEEWALLDLTLRLIAEHGAIGGKTVFKPTDEELRQGQIHHQDFGLIQMSQGPTLTRTFDEAALRTYATDSRWRKATQKGIAWASLANFWSVSGRCLARQDADTSTFNQVIGRGEPKNSAGNGDSWLAGRRARSENRKKNQSKVEAESKKVFSFRDPARTFGFVNPDGGDEQVTFDTIRQRLEAAWGSVNVDPGDEASEGIPLLTGPRILESLLSKEATR